VIYSKNLCIFWNKNYRISRV